MARIERFEDLEIWRESIQIGVKIYKLCENSLLKNDFSAKDQLRRAAVSISNNIAEGFEYNNNKVFQKFLTYAKGSAGEVRSQLFLLREIGIVSETEFEILNTDLIKLSKGIAGFKKYLKGFESSKDPKSSNL
jgi:four helix bundle protein